MWKRSEASREAVLPEPTSVANPCLRSTRLVPRSDARGSSPIASKPRSFVESVSRSCRPRPHDRRRTRRRSNVAHAGRPAGHALAKMIVMPATTRSGDPTRGCAASFVISEQRRDFADERRTRRYRPSGAPAADARDLPLAARRPGDSEGATACGTRGRAARASNAATEASRLIL